MYVKDQTRIASSTLTGFLFGSIEKYRAILIEEKNKLMKKYPDEVLDNMFAGVDSRIINICPMVLCDALLTDLLVDCPDDLLAGVGISMYSISTHDDVVDELPTERSDIAGLIYSGNIATLHGVQRLINSGYTREANEVINYTNLNHYYQTKIVNTLWSEPADEQVYLKAISHTKYWAQIGPKVAIVYANRPDLDEFVDEFAECYGYLCQIYDDMREIKDDVINKYWSLPVSYAKVNHLNLELTEHLNQSIARSGEIAADYYKKAQELCEKYQFKKLGQLIENIGITGKSIKY